ncbi:MAG: helix-turn-helix domain-containing protein [Candidatus Omnitrophota bacterium]
MDANSHKLKKLTVDDEREIKSLFEISQSLAMLAEQGAVVSHEVDAVLSSVRLFLETLKDNSSFFQQGQPGFVLACPENDSENKFQEIVDDLLSNAKFPPEKEPYKLIIAKMDKVLIRTVLGKVKMNQSQAAKMLGISRNTLRSKIKEYGLA